MTPLIDTVKTIENSLAGRDDDDDDNDDFDQKINGSISQNSLTGMQESNKREK